MTTANVFALTDTWNAGATTFDAISMDVTATAHAAASQLLNLKTGGVQRVGVRAPHIALGADVTPFLNLVDVWNTSGTITGIKFNITDTASAAASLLMDLQVGGVSKLRIEKDGDLISAGRFIAALDFGFSTNTGGLYFGSGSDVVVLRDNAANTLALRNGEASQTENFYDRWASTTDYHRVAIKTARATLSGVTGASVTATAIIPDGAVVVGVTTKVTTGLGVTGGTTGYNVGDGSDVDRWGAIVGTASGTSSDNTNWTAGTIQAFTVASDIVLTAVGGNFDGTGVIYVSVQYLIGQCD